MKVVGVQPTDVVKEPVPSVPTIDMTDGAKSRAAEACPVKNAVPCWLVGSGHGAKSAWRALHSAQGHPYFSAPLRVALQPGAVVASSPSQCTSGRSECV